VTLGPLGFAFSNAAMSSGGDFFQAIFLEVSQSIGRAIFPH